MRGWLGLAVVIAVGCGSDPSAPATSPSTSPSASPSTSPSTSTSTTSPSISGNPADCERVLPCAEAFAAVAPAELAAPARVAAEQLDHSLAESPARAGACTAALASFRADLERLELDVPEACAIRTSATP